MRLLVCGSRGWTDRELLERVLDEQLEDVREHWWEDPVIVHGKAPGADEMADTWATERGLTIEPYPADWSTGRGAGHVRNREMLAAGIDGAVAFSTNWPATPGTAGMCRLAVDAGHVVVFVTPGGTVREFLNPHTQLTLDT